MKLPERIRRLTEQAQKFLPQPFPDYGLQAPPEQHAPGFAEYEGIDSKQEPILALPPGTLPDGTYCVATARGDAALCTRALAHIDIDDQLLPPDYRDSSSDAADLLDCPLPPIDLPELLADRTAAAWQTHIGTAPAWIAVYQTFAGWRVLAPWHAEAHIAALLIPGCDPRYVYVTHRQQGLHRIRLLQKRWRDSEYQVAERVLFRGSASAAEAAVLAFHDIVCCAEVGAAVCS